MKNKKIVLELVNDIETLIGYQEYTVKEIQQSQIPEEVVDFQKDILRILKAVQKMGIRAVNLN